MAVARGSRVQRRSFSNFAPLNCELSLDPLRRLLQQALPPGGRFVGVVLPRLCPLEIALFLARGQPRTALRRFRRNPVADVDGVRFPMRYYGARDFDAALGPGFRRIQTRSLGLVLPPLSFGPALARWPRLMAALAAVEDRLAGVAGLSRMGDHVILGVREALMWRCVASAALVRHGGGAAVRAAGDAAGRAAAPVQRRAVSVRDAGGCGRVSRLATARTSWRGLLDVRRWPPSLAAAAGLAVVPSAVRRLRAASSAVHALQVRAPRLRRYAAGRRGGRSAARPGDDAARAAWRWWAG